MCSNINYSLIAKTINSKIESYEPLVKSSYNKATVIPVQQFQARIQSEMQTLSLDLTPTKDKEPPTVQEFANLFKSFDELPPCFQKIRKPTKDVSKMNTTISMKQKEHSTNGSTLNLAVKAIPDEVPKRSSTEVYQSYVSCKKQIHELQTEIVVYLKQLQNYDEDLSKLKRFAHELDRLIPKSDTALEKAFTSEEEQKIKEIARNLNKFIYIRENVNFYKMTNYEPTLMLQTLVEILNESLQGISYYQSI